MALLIGVIFAINAVLRRHRDSKSWAEDFKILNYLPEVITVLKYWLGFFLYSHLSLVIQVLIMYGVIRSWLFDFVLETVFLFGFTYLIYESDTLCSTRVVIFFKMIIHYFKMNSYSKTNRAYRRLFLSKGVPKPISQTKQKKGEWQEDKVIQGPGSST
jgi:hypothetical protein